MSKPKIPSTRAERQARALDCQTRLIALVDLAGDRGISSAEIRDSLAVRFDREEVMRATRVLNRSGRIVMGERVAYGYQWRSPAVAREAAAALRGALGELAAATRKAAA